MASLTAYKELQIVTPDPTGDGGLALNTNFKKIANSVATVQSGVPDNTDDSAHNFIVGARWYDTSTNIEWICLDDTTGAAQWAKLSNNPFNQSLNTTNSPTFVSITANGSGLSNLNAANLSTGTVPTARLGTGAASSTTVLLGNSTWGSYNPFDQYLNVVDSPAFAGINSNGSFIFYDVPSDTEWLGFDGTEITLAGYGLNMAGGTGEGGSTIKMDGGTIDMGGNPPVGVPPGNIHMKGGTIDMSAGAVTNAQTVTSNVFAPTVVALTDGANIASNATAGSIFTVTLGGNRMLSNPSTPTNGQTIIYRIKQDVTGGRTLAYGTAFKFGATIPSPTLSTAAGAVDELIFRYDSVQAKWWAVGFNKGF